MFHIDREDYWGNNSILADVSAGELLGEVYSFLDDEPVRINAVAVKDSTVLLLDVKKIFQVCSTVCPDHAQLIRNFAYVLAVKNRELTRKLEHMSQRTTRDKLLSYLSDQSLKQDSSCFEIPFNRQQLADFLAVGFESAMSKELGKLRDEGILEFNKNHFELKQGGEVFRDESGVDFRILIFYRKLPGMVYGSVFSPLLFGQPTRKEKSINPGFLRRTVSAPLRLRFCGACMPCPR